MLANEDTKSIKVLIIVLAYNEGRNLPALFDALNSVGESFEGELDIIAINDCSKDDTELVCKNYGIKVVSLPINLGIGGAVQTGYRYANENNFDIAIQVDGDGQHDPRFIPALVKQIEGGANLCIGSRFIENQGFQSSKIRRLGIRYFSWLIWFLTGLRITDPTSGYRACSREVIRLFAHNYPKDYPEPETVVTILRNKLRVTEVAVIMNARECGKSSITKFRGIFYMIKVTLAIIIACIAKTTIPKEDANGHE